LHTAIPSETIRQSTRVPTRILLTIVSLNPYIEFSEACHAVSVNAQGCAMHCQKSIPVATPVLLRLENGKEARGQVAFCKGSSSNEKLWGLGIVLDKPGNFWGLNPCPKDWLECETNAVVSPLDKQDHVHGAKISESPITPGITAAEVESMCIELQGQMRKEMAATLADVRTRFDEELLAQNNKTVNTEKLLQEAVNVRESLYVTMQSLQEALDNKVSDGAKDAIEQIEVCMNTHRLSFQSDSERLLQQVRNKTDEVNSCVQQAVESELEKAQKQMSAMVEEKKQEIVDATSSIAKVSDQIYSNVQRRLEEDFVAKQEIITSSRNAIAAEAALFEKEVRSTDDRIAKLTELSVQLETNFTTRLDQSASETSERARATMERLFIELRTEQIEQARADMETVLSPISTRLNALVEEGSESISQLTRERDETKIQSSAAKELKEEMQLWLAQQTPDFEKTVNKVLSDAREQAKTLMQTALDAIRNPVDILSREAKRNIEEFTTRQHSDLGDGIRRLQDVLATLEQQAEESLQASFQATGGTPVPEGVVPQDKVEVDLRGNARRSNGRSQTTFAKKLSGLVRGRDSSQ
jgi:hypothetical protein